MAVERQISEFWRWFQTVCDQFGERFENRELLEELDTRVSQLGDFSWELGPGVKDDRNSVLALTPSGDPLLLAETRKIVAIAPDCPGWEFYPAKPPKRWFRRYVLHHEDGSEKTVDASGARYVLLMYPDGVFDVSIADRNLAALPESLRQTAAEVLLDGELGEEGRIALIHSVEVVAEFDEQMQQKSSSIESLGKHLRSIAG